MIDQLIKPELTTIELTARLMESLLPDMDEEVENVWDAIDSIKAKTAAYEAFSDMVVHKPEMLPLFTTDLFEMLEPFKAVLACKNCELTMTAETPEPILTTNKYLLKYVIGEYIKNLKDPSKINIEIVRDGTEIKMFIDRPCQINGPHGDFFWWLVDGVVCKSHWYDKRGLVLWFHDAMPYFFLPA